MRISQLLKVMNKMNVNIEKMKNIRAEIKMLKDTSGDNQVIQDLYEQHSTLVREHHLLDAVFEANTDIDLYRPGRRILRYSLKSDSPEFLKRIMTAFPDDTKIVYKNAEPEGYYIELLLENSAWPLLKNKTGISCVVDRLDDGKLYIKLDELPAFTTLY